MTAYQSPFQFGTLATEENFIDRVEDRAMLKQMLASHINVMLISQRRWGKSSLVKKAMGELSAEDKNVRICYIDAFSIGIGADVQLDLFETAHIRLECPYRLNQKDWKPTFIPFAKARKRIETIFSQLTDQFLVIRNYAKITNGLFARIIGKISALTILQYVNFINISPLAELSMH